MVESNTLSEKAKESKVLTEEHACMHTRTVRKLQNKNYSSMDLPRERTSGQPPFISSGQGIDTTATKMGTGRPTYTCEPLHVRISPKDEHRVKK